jgi:hypothetical protein
LLLTKFPIAHEPGIGQSDYERRDETCLNQADSMTVFALQTGDVVRGCRRKPPLPSMQAAILKRQK